MIFEPLEYRTDARFTADEEYIRRSAPRAGKAADIPATGCGLLGVAGADACRSGREGGGVIGRRTVKQARPKRSTEPLQQELPTLSVSRCEGHESCGAEVRGGRGESHAPVHLSCASPGARRSRGRATVSRRGT
jgi:hypothetical protein